MTKLAATISANNRKMAAGFMRRILNDWLCAAIARRLLESNPRRLLRLSMLGVGELLQPVAGCVKPPWNAYNLRDLHVPARSPEERPHLRRTLCELIPSLRQRSSP